MSKQSKIRWQKTDTEELSRAVKNFNAKITRIEKKNPELKNALPERMSARQLKEMITTRQDLKRELNSLKRFTDKTNVIGITKDGEYQGIEIIESPNNYNTKITTWQRKEINRRLPTINRRREERLKMLEERDVISRGDKQGYKKGHLGLGRAELLELKPMAGLTPGMNEAAIKMKYKSVLAESQRDFFTAKDFRAKENYIKGLNNNFSPEDVKEIAETIKNMPIDKFLDTFQSDPDAKFSELYTPNQREYKKAVKLIKSVWMPNR